MTLERDLGYYEMGLLVNTCRRTRFQPGTTMPGVACHRLSQKVKGMSYETHL